MSSESRDPDVYQFLVGASHLDDNDGLVLETTREAVQKGFIVANRPQVISSNKKPREVVTPVHITEVATPQTLLPSGDSVLYAPTTLCDTPVVDRHDNISCDPDRQIGAPDVAPAQSPMVPI